MASITSYCHFENYQILAQDKLLVVFVCLHTTLPNYHHYIDLPESIKLLKWLPGTFYFECVSQIKPILSIIFHAILGAVRIQFTHFSYDDLRIRVLNLIIIIKSEVWPICHCLGLGHETMVCAVCRFIILSHTHIYFLTHNSFTPSPN